MKVDMTDHPDAAALTHAANSWGDIENRTVDAMRAGAAAIRALQALRPHTPDAIVGRRYAHLFVDFDALVAAQDIVGVENALPRFDIEAARLAHTQDRAAHYQGVDGADNRTKWDPRA